MSINKKIYYISDVFKSEPNGGNKAKSDFNTVFNRLGFIELDLSIKSKNKLIRNIIKLFLPFKLLFKGLRLKENDIVFVQVPTYSLRLYSPILFYLKKIKNFDLVIVIHDIERLRNTYAFSERFLKNEDIYFELSDAIICHNQVMKDYLVERGIAGSKIYSLGIFDYILDNSNGLNIAKVNNKKIVNLAGSMDVKRSPYVYKLLDKNWGDIELRLYGPLYDKTRVKNNTTCYKGCYPSDEIPYKLLGGWGLVWDGESIDDCTGNIGNYLKYINQHKVSLYIASGIPVIIWERAGLAEFVKSNKIGIVISDLNLLEQTIHDIQDDDYENMVQNVLHVRKKLLTGGYAEDAIGSILANLLD